MIISMIERIQTGHTGLLNERNADIFRNAFTFLSSLNMPTDAVYTDLLAVVFNCPVSKAWYNLNIAKNDIMPLLADNSWYKLLIPQEELVLNDFSDFSRWTKIATALLRKY